MKVLAIDASTKSTGVALFEDTKLIKYECLTATSTDLIKRIQKIIQQLHEFTLNETIDKIILEEVRPENGLQNIKTHNYHQNQAEYVHQSLPFCRHLHHLHYLNMYD